LICVMGFPGNGSARARSLAIEFASLFKEVRKRHGLSQSQAAKRWKVRLKALQNWEQGMRIPGGRNLIQLLPILFPDKFRSHVKLRRSRARRSNVRSRRDGR
jgi:transcriptional regulator with XRE-family HTH domain